jgi:hypothetical protein
MLDDHGDSGRWGLSVVALVAATLVLYFFWRTPRTDDRMLGALALLLGGIAGNLTDRMRLGFVIDFVDVQFGSWHYPTFNGCRRVDLHRGRLVDPRSVSGQEESKAESKQPKGESGEPVGTHCKCLSANCIEAIYDCGSERRTIDHRPLT